MAARAEQKSPAKKTATTKKSASGTPRKVVRKPQKVEPTINAYIPDSSVAAKYVGRKVFGVWDAVIADIALENKQNILLSGDTGSGKTMFGEAYASKNQMLYYSLACDVSIDPSALFGRMQPTDVPGKFRWQDGPVTQVVRNGGVLNISEINFMPPKIAASLYPLLDGRRYVPLLGHEGEVVRAADNLLIIADMNPQYRGTMELNAAFKNRFDIKLPWGYDKEVEDRLVKFPTLRDIAKRIRDLVGTEIMTPVSTNMLMEFESFTMDKRLGLGFAVQNFMAAFELDEQQPISKVFELNESRLEKDIEFFSNKKKKSASGESASNDEDDLEEIDWEMEVEQ